MWKSAFPFFAAAFVGVLAVVLIAAAASAVVAVATTAATSAFARIIFCERDLKITNHLVRNAGFPPYAWKTEKPKSISDWRAASNRNLNSRSQPICAVIVYRWCVLGIGIQSFQTHSYKGREGEEEEGGSDISCFACRQAGGRRSTQPYGKNVADWGSGKLFWEEGENLQGFFLLFPRISKKTLKGKRYELRIRIIEQRRECSKLRMQRYIEFIFRKTIFRASWLCSTPAPATSGFRARSATTPTSPASCTTSTTRTSPPPTPRTERSSASSMGPVASPDSCPRYETEAETLDFLKIVELRDGGGNECTKYAFLDRLGYRSRWRR